MKTIEEYMRLPYRMEILPDPVEGGYAVRFPELPGCMTCGDTLEEALRNADDCRREWINAALEEGIEIPEPVSEEEYSGQFKLRIPKSLHKSLAEHSRAEGISMNQYCLYLLAKNDGMYGRK
ncbi:MAG: toxin-antitoxin system HicB family antitoxin [Clostridia bacterium]|nr:toxin-antitoxin system HicB family antitoxin [Clostridia bacterium]